jgi:hypothetical protein
MAVEVVAVVRAVELPLAGRSFLQTLGVTGDPSGDESRGATLLRLRSCVRV